MVWPIHWMITMFIITLGKWLQRELSKHRRGLQLESLVRHVEGRITMYMATLSRWLKEKMSKHRLELFSKMLANPRRGWHLESMVRHVESLITKFMHNNSMPTMVIIETWW